MNKRPNILVYTPYFRGFYLGEVANALFSLANQERFNLIHIRTGGFDHFDLPIALNKADGVITVMNAISTKLAEQVCARGIPFVSLGHDFFPLQVEFIGGDNRNGIYQSVGHLFSKQCRHIGFVGDMRITDMRIRFQAFREALKSFQLSFDESRIYSINNPDFQGGIESAKQFIERGKNCDALIFAADKMALGFQSYCQKHNIKIPEELLISAYDNSQLAQCSTPPLTSVDQNIDQLTEKAVNRVLARINGDGYQDDLHLISPLLTLRESTNDSHIERHEKSAKIPNHTHTEQVGENILAMAADGLPSLQAYSQLYGPFNEWALLSEIDDRVDHFEKAEIIGVYNGGSAADDIYNLHHYTCHDFPIGGLKQIPTSPFILNVMPVQSGEHHYKTLLSMTDTSKVSQLDALVDYGCFMEIMTGYLHRDHRLPVVEAQELPISTSGFQWTWNLNSNQVNWGNKILELLGYNTQSEQALYENMGFFEKIHHDDLNYVRSLIKNHLQQGQKFTCQFRMGSHEEGYVWVKAKGRPEVDNTGKTIRVIGSIAEIPHQYMINHAREVYLVQQDQLTGLPSRLNIREKLEELIKHNSRQRFSIIWFSLNRFSNVNEEYGLDVGDAVLKETATRLQEKLANNQFISRFGSDEFVVVSPIQKIEIAGDIAKALQKIIEKPFYFKENECISISARAGISIYPNHSSHVNDLFKQASIAANHAKKQHIQLPVLYTSDLISGTYNKITLESALRGAIDSDELYLNYQPQIDIHSEQLVGVESLCRWQSHELGNILPDQFITLAEETGIIHKLGDWIVHEALHTLKFWEDNGLSHIKMAINVSANQLLDPGFIDRFIDTVNQLKFNKPSIAIEITETAAVNDLKQTCDYLNQFVNMGINISLDDFGTGFSSLSLLKALPIQWVKIDKSFVDNIESNQADQGIVRSICQLKDILNYRVIVEGVETEAQLAIVKRLGCDVVQGYIYSKPINKNELLETYLNRHKHFKKA